MRINPFWIIVAAAVASGIILAALIVFNRAPAPPPIPADGQPRPSEIPPDWRFVDDAASGYSIFYPSDWELDAVLEESPQSGVRAFNTKEREPSEGFYIIRTLFDANESSLEYLDANFAQPFRDQALPGTLSEEVAGVQGRSSLSLEANIRNVKTQEAVKAYLLLIPSKDGKPGYAISAIARGPKTETFLEQARLMTRSFRIF